MKRDWRDAVAAHEGHGCRVCLQWPRELAHVIPRKYDQRPGRRAAVVKVHPLAVVPLCAHHHHLYDDHVLDLVRFLTVEEIAHAADRVGKGPAERYIRGRTTICEAVVSAANL